MTMTHHTNSGDVLSQLRARRAATSKRFELGQIVAMPPAAYFGDRDRSFRRIVTVAQSVVLRVQILKQAVTMSPYIPSFLSNQT